MNSYNKLLLFHMVFYFTKVIPDGDSNRKTFHSKYLYSNILHFKFQFSTRCYLANNFFVYNRYAISNTDDAYSYYQLLPIRDLLY